MQQIKLKKKSYPTFNWHRVFSDGVNLENLIYLIVFLLPLYLVKVDVLRLRTNALEFLIAGALVWWLVAFYNYGKVKSFYAQYRRYVLSGGIMFFGLFASAFLNEQSFQSLSIIKSWFVIPLALMLVAADVVPKERMKNVFVAYAASAFFVALISLGYLFLGRLTYDLRLEAFFNSPNYLAMYLAPGILFGLWEGAFSKKKIIVLFLGVLLVTFFFTYSYAAYAAVFASSIFVLWKTGGYAKTKKIFSKEVVVLVLVIVSFSLLQLNNKKFKDVLELNPRSSLSSRVMIWRSALKIAENNAVLGIGAANFQKTYLEYQKFFPLYLEWAVPHPQNLYLAFWLSGGIFGLGGFLGLIFFLCRDLLKNKSQNSLEILALGIIFYILVHGLVDTTYFKNDLAIVFWLNFLVLKKQ